MSEPRGSCVEGRRGEKRAGRHEAALLFGAVIRPIPNRFIIHSQWEPVVTAPDCSLMMTQIGSLLCPRYVASADERDAARIG